MTTLVVGIYLFDEVEVLDFAGPFEVFSTAARLHARSHPEDDPLFEAVTIADSMRLVRARAGLMIQPAYDITNHPPLDIVLIPGGVVTAELERGEIIKWIKAQAGRAQLTASVCTGAFLLAGAGLLEQGKATTHWEDVDDFRALFPQVGMEADQRWVESGQVITSAGISAGIDMSLHVVARFKGMELAVRTARQMDYRWQTLDD